MKATQVVTAGGGSLIVEPGEDRCWDGEEVFEQEVDVLSGTCCDICDEEIDDEGEAT